MNQSCVGHMISKFHIVTNYTKYNTEQRFATQFCPKPIAVRHIGRTTRTVAGLTLNPR